MALSEITPVKFLTLTNFKNLLIKLLPIGIVWDIIGDDLKDLCEAFAEELNRFDQRCIDFLTENIPGLSTDAEMLGDWERIAYLEDEFPDATATEAERQTLVHTKIFTSLDGPTETFFTAYAAKLNITITSFGTQDIFRVGIGRVGDRINDASSSGFTWVVNYTGGTSVEHQAMKVYFNRLKPAHTIVEFNPAIP